MEMELHTRAEALGDLAWQLDMHADHLWQLGGDLDRWGLGEDAEEARVRACALRVGAVINRAKAAGLTAKFADMGDPFS